MSKQVNLLSMKRAYLFAARGVCEAEPGLNNMPERVGLSEGNCTLCLGIGGLFAPGSDQYSGLSLRGTGAASGLLLEIRPEDSALL